MLDDLDDATKAAPDWGFRAALFAALLLGLTPFSLAASVLSGLLHSRYLCSVPCAWGDLRPCDSGLSRQRLTIPNVCRLVNSDPIEPGPAGMIRSGQPLCTSKGGGRTYQVYLIKTRRTQALPDDLLASPSWQPPTAWLWVPRVAPAGTRLHPGPRSGLAYDPDLHGAWPIWER